METDNLNRNGGDGGDDDDVVFNKRNTKTTTKQQCNATKHAINIAKHNTSNRSATQRGQRSRKHNRPTDRPTDHLTNKEDHQINTATRQAQQHNSAATMQTATDAHRSKRTKRTNAQTQTSLQTHQKTRSETLLPLCRAGNYNVALNVVKWASQRTAYTNYSLRSSL